MHEYLNPADYAPTWYWWLPPGYSSFSEPVDNLFLWVFWITTFFFFLVELLIVYFCFKYKRRENVRATYTRGSHKLELAWTVIPSVILVLLGIGSNETWAKIKNAHHGEFPKEGQYGCEVMIVAQQFAWNVTYQGIDGKLGTDDDFTLKNSFNVPVGEKIRIKLTSQDVIHSFFAPVLRLKQDAVPGYVGNLWFDVSRPTFPGPDGKDLTNDVEYAADGKTIVAQEECYEVACAELCGISHYTMRMQLKAVPRASFDAWARVESEKAMKQREEERKAQR